MQNGVQKNEALARVFGPFAVLGAISMIGAEVLPARGDEPGAVHCTRAGLTPLGELAGGKSLRVDAVMGALKRAGLNVQASDGIELVEWSNS